MPDESTIASKLTEIATALSGVLADSNTALAAKEVSPADDLSGIPAQISAIETGSGGITPTGTKSITTNGTHDVTTYASANVNVPTGTVKTAEDITVSGNTVTVPAGLYAEATSKSVPTVSHLVPTISVNTSTGRVQAEHRQATGYVTGSNLATGLDLPTVGTATYTPGTTDQTIPSGKYLTGTQTIKGDADLIASNIKKNVNIFGVQGTYEGSSGTPTAEKKSSYVTVSRTSAKMLAVSGLSVSSGEKLSGLILISNEIQQTTQNYYADAITLVPQGSGWYALCLGYVGGRTFFQNYDITVTKYGETACEVYSGGDVNFVASYMVFPIVAKAS